MIGDPFILANDEYFWVTMIDETKAMASFGGTQPECTAMQMVLGEGVVVRRQQLKDLLLTSGIEVQEVDRKFWEMRHAR